MRRQGRNHRDVKNRDVRVDIIFNNNINNNINDNINDNIDINRNIDKIDGRGSRLGVKFGWRRALWSFQRSLGLVVGPLFVSV